MIEVTVELTGFFVDKPRKLSILIDDDTTAIEKKNEATGKLEAVTVGQLFDLWKKQSLYVKEASDPEDHLTADFFPIYIYERYIKGNSFANSIVKIEYKKL